MTINVILSESYLARIQYTFSPYNDTDFENWLDLYKKAVYGSLTPQERTRIEQLEKIDKIPMQLSIDKVELILTDDISKVNALVNVLRLSQKETEALLQAIETLKKEANSVTRPMSELITEYCS